MKDLEDKAPLASFLGTRALVGQAKKEFAQDNGR